jgi:hypothetical protein
MKRSFYILSALLVMLVPLFASCSNDEQEQYNAQMEAYQQQIEAHQKYQEDYYKAIEKALNDYNKAYNEWQQAQLQQLNQVPGVGGVVIVTANETQPQSDNQ